MPVRLAMMREWVVVVAVEEMVVVGDEGRERSSFSEVRVLVGCVSDQAREKGWFIQKLMLGM